MTIRAIRFGIFHRSFTILVHVFFRMVLIVETRTPERRVEFM